MRTIAFNLLIFSVFLPLLIYGQDSLSTKIDFVGKAEHLFYTNLDSSIYYFQKGLDYYPGIEDWENYVACHNALTSAFGQKGNINQSYAHALIAFASAEKHLDKNNNTAYGSALNNLAIFNRRKGDYEKAMPLYKSALEIERTSESGKLADELAILKNLGSLFFETGDYSESKKYYSQAINKGLEHLETSDPMITSSYLELAELYNTIGQRDTAYILYQKVLQEITQHSLNDIRTKNRMVTIHLNLGDFFWQQKKEELSKKHIHKALRFSQKHLNKAPLDAYLLLGKWAKHQKKFDLAIQHFEQALLINQKKNKTLGKSTETGMIYYQLASTYFEQGDLKNSLQHFQNSLAQYSKKFSPANDFQNPALSDLPSDQYILKTFLGKANTLFQIYHRDKNIETLLAAKETYQLTIQLLNKLRQSYHGIGSKEILAENVLPIFEGALQCYFELQKTQTSESLINEAFQIAENSKAILLLESINENSALGIAGISDQLLEEEKSLKGQIIYHQKQLISTPDTAHEKIQTLEKGLFELEQKHQELLLHFEENYPNYHQLKYNTSIVHIEEIRKKLKPNESALVEYFVGEKNLYIFCITTQTAHFIQLDKTPDLNQKVEDIRNLLIHPPAIKTAEKDFEQFTQSAHALYQQLIAPTRLEESIYQIIIVPDDLLAYIPFEILLSKLPKNQNIDYLPNNLSYLLNDFQISYNYSATLFARENSNTQQAKHDFIGFAPSFGEPKNANASRNSFRNCTQEDLYPLICNKEEVEQISKIFNGAAITGSQANKALFAESIQDYRIAHFATHSCLDDQNPMLNKIFLADGYLSNFDLYNLELQTELAVLSACNTGSGQLRRGEGVMSLSRGFMHAGCPSVLMSLWSVEDCTTSAIMNKYYQGIKAGQTKDFALQESKKFYLQEATKLASHPFYWAPFVQFGKIEAMDFQSTWLPENLAFGAFAFGAFLLALVYWRRH